MTAPSSTLRISEKDDMVTLALVPLSPTYDEKSNDESCMIDGTQPRHANAADMEMVKDALSERRRSDSTKSVDVLDLSHCDFSDPQGFQCLLDIIRNDCPPCLDLSATKFASRSEFSTLLSVLQVNKSIVDLNLSNYLCSDYFTADGSLHRLLRTNSTLKKIDLSGHSLETEVIRDLVQGIQESESKITELKLHSCLLNDESASLILQHGADLEVLDLSANGNLSTQFLNTSLAALLRQSTNLQFLTLDHCSSMFPRSQNRPSTVAIQPFLDALANNTTCHSLSLRYCRMQEAVGEALLRAVVKNKTLRSLNLEFSGFGLRDNGNEILIQYIPEMKTLQELRIITQYSPELAPKLMQALKKNSSLQVFKPRFKSLTKDNKECVMGILERNLRLAQSQSLLDLCPSASYFSNGEQETEISAAILPEALSQLSQTKNGSAATFHVLQHWISECI